MSFCIVKKKKKLVPTLSVTSWINSGSCFMSCDMDSSILLNMVQMVHRLDWHHLLRMEWKEKLFTTDREGQFVSSHDPDASDGVVIVNAWHNDAGKGVLSQFFKALEHTWGHRQGYCRPSLTTQKYLQLKSRTKLDQQSLIDSFILVAYL